jgi:hypothetical protein
MAIEIPDRALNIRTATSGRRQAAFLLIAAMVPQSIIV